MPNLILKEELISLVKKRLAEDPLREKPGPKSKTSINGKLYAVLQLFITEELKTLNSDLFNHFLTTKTKERNNIYYFDQKTLYRAVNKGYSASVFLYNLLGYYAFLNDWPDHREKYVHKNPDGLIVKHANRSVENIANKEQSDVTITLEKEPTENIADNEHSDANRVKETTGHSPKRSSIIHYLFTGGFLLFSIGMLWLFYQKKPLPEKVNCDCPLEKIHEEETILDSTTVSKVIELESWSYLEKLDPSISKEDLTSPPTAVEKKITTTIQKFKNDFEPQKEKVLASIFFRTTFCAIDELYCEDTTLTASQKREERKQNFLNYNEHIKELVLKLKAPSTKTSPIEDKPKPAIKRFSVIGIHHPDLFIKELESTTDLKSSFSKEVNFKIEFSSTETVIKRNKSDLYFQIPGKLVVKVNDHQCYIFDQPEYRIEGTPKLPGNTISIVERNLKKQVNTVVNAQYKRIAKQLTRCLKD